MSALVEDWPVYFGGERRFVYEDRKKVPKPPIPKPEVYARPAKLEEMGDAATRFAKKLREQGWQIRVTYARGPHVSADGEDVLSIADSILVVGRKDRVWLACCWIHRDDSVTEKDPSGKWELANCHVRDPYPARPRRIKWPAVAAYLREEVNDGNS